MVTRREFARGVFVSDFAETVDVEATISDAQNVNTRDAEEVRRAFAVQAVINRHLLQMIVNLEKEVARLKWEARP